MKTEFFTGIKDPGGRFKIPIDITPTDPESPKPKPPAVVPDGDALERFIDQSYKQFAPEEIEYQARSEEEIRNSIAAWLQPGYDGAISERKEQTRQNNANLDADAIARGMGASTFVTDVKNRQQHAESSDIATLRANYGAALSKNVFDSVNAEKEHALEVNEFNAQQRQQAYELAYQAALVLYAQYLKDPKKYASLLKPRPPTKPRPVPDGVRHGGVHTFDGEQPRKIARGQYGAL